MPRQNVSVWCASGRSAATARSFLMASEMK
jgi:hypothetical protein